MADITANTKPWTGWMCVEGIPPLPPLHKVIHDNFITLQEAAQVTAPHDPGQVASVATVTTVPGASLNCLQSSRKSVSSLPTGDCWDHWHWPRDLLHSLSATSICHLTVTSMQPELSSRPHNQIIRNISDSSAKALKESPKGQEEHKPWVSADDDV